MNCSFSDPVLIKKIIATIGQGTDMVNFTFEPTALVIRSMNQTKTNLLHVNLDKELFTTYNCDTITKIGLHIPPLQHLMRSVGPKDTLQWNIEPNRAIMSIIVMDGSENKTVTQYDLRLIDLDEDELIIPDNIQYDIKCRIGTAVIRSWRHKTALTKGMVTFNASKTRFEVIAKSIEWGTVTIQQPLPSVTAIIVESVDDLTHSATIPDKSMGSIDTMVQCTPGVDIGFKENMPLSVTGYFDPEKKSYITLWVAPCDVGDEED